MIALARPDTLPAARAHRTVVLYDRARPGEEVFVPEDNDVAASQQITVRPSPSFEGHGAIRVQSGLPMSVPGLVFFATALFPSETLGALFRIRP